MIIYRKGNLFEGAPADAVLAHACNAQGVWGAGIAAEFARRFPEQYQEYRDECARVINPRNLVGYGMLIGRVGCLVTSYGYGANKDSEEQILSATSSVHPRSTLASLGYPGKRQRMLLIVTWLIIASLLGQCGSCNVQGNA